MSNLGKRAIIGADWIQSAQPTLNGFLNCEIELIDMKLGDLVQNYDWRTNESTETEPVILFSGQAQMQVYRFTLTMDAPVGSVDQVRNARFTIAHPEIEDVDIRKGQRIRIVNCDNDHTLERYQYVVNSGFNSGSSFRRTIETEVDMARVMP